jgi:hypothetical protein
MPLADQLSPCGSIGVVEKSQRFWPIGVNLRRHNSGVSQQLSAADGEGCDGLVAKMRGGGSSPGGPGRFGLFLLTYRRGSSQHFSAVMVHPRGYSATRGVLATQGSCFGQERNKGI